MGEAVHAGARTTVDATLKFQEEAMEQCSNPVAKAMALEHKSNVEASTSKALGLEAQVVISMLLHSHTIMERLGKMSLPTKRGMKTGRWQWKNLG
mgnify:CR=1 FL=1